MDIENALGHLSINRKPPSPVELFAEGYNATEINKAFRHSFVPPKGILFPPSLPVIYAGGEVLRVFYQDENWGSSDLDVFLPVWSQGSPDDGLMSVEPSVQQLELTTPMRIGTSMAKVMRLKEESGRIVDIVAVVFDQDADTMTHKEFQAIVEARVDIKLCAMAWTGSELIYPRMNYELIALKTSTVSTAMKTKDAEDPAYMAFSRRLLKYRTRKFTLFWEE